MSWPNRVTEEQANKADAERLRDTFAAAALTGLLSNIPRYQLGVIAVQAYDIADEMLRERLRNGVAESRENEHYRGVEELGRPRRAHNPEIAGSNPAAPTHDAAPEAIANADGEPAPKCGGEAGLSSREGTGNTPSEAEINALEFVVEEGRIGNYGILRSWLIRLRPEWESQSYEESDEKRVNTNTNRDTTRGEGSVRDEGTVGERLVGRLSITQAMLADNERLRAENARLREAIRRLADQDATLSVQGGSVTVTMDATLTNAEREVLEGEVELAEYQQRHELVATLRGLLERLGGER